MKNSFNLEVCFKDAPVMPYEWNDTQIIMHVKLTRVSTSLLKDVLAFRGTLENCKGTMLLSDTKNAVALKLSDTGEIVKRSFLSFDRSLDVCEFAFNLKETKLSFSKTQERIDYPKNLSIELEMKEYIVKNISDTKDEDLAKYLYYLYFGDLKSYSKEKLIQSVEKASLDDNMKLYKFLIES